MNIGIDWIVDFAFQDATATVVNPCFLEILQIPLGTSRGTTLLHQNQGIESCDVNVIEEQPDPPPVETINSCFTIKTLHVSHVHTSHVLVALSNGTWSVNGDCVSLVFAPSLAFLNNSAIKYHVC